MSNPEQDLHTEVDVDLQKLEIGIRQLKIEYDRFLGGGLKREPVRMRFQVQKQIKCYNDTRGKKFHHRFHFNALVSRFISLSELWGKRVRAQELGAAQTAEKSVRQSEQCVASCRIQATEHDGAALREIYERFVEAREKQGQKRGKLSFEKFVRGVTAQTRKLQKDAGCAEIELRLVVSDEKVQLKALRG